MVHAYITSKLAWFSFYETWVALCNNNNKNTCNQIEIKDNYLHINGKRVGFFQHANALLALYVSVLRIFKVIYVSKLSSMITTSES